MKALLLISGMEIIRKLIPLKRGIASHGDAHLGIDFGALPPLRLRLVPRKGGAKVRRNGNESSFALCRLKLEEPMFPGL